MIHPEYEYLKLLAKLLKNGKGKKTRGIHGGKSLFGYQMRFDFRHGFPVLTTKKMPWKIMTRELLWFISGSSNIRKLQEKGIKYWDDFADTEGNLGPVYGVQWRKWPAFTPLTQPKPDFYAHEMSETDSFKSDFPKPKYWVDENGDKHEFDNKVGLYQRTELDQLKWAISEIKNNPDSKAIIVQAWNTAYLDSMRLPPCHTMFQFDVTKGKLRLHLYQRSSDVFLGLPFNITQYALLLAMVAHVTGLEAREFVVSIGSALLYYNHIEPAKEQLKRKPYPFPKLWLNPEVTDIDNFSIKDIKRKGYEAHPRIKGELVVL
ncbi:MAG: thymidylate synthase [Candidatus Dojkabacteria bacterium]|nr:thymidylate synthase [Candidatus Dojkabacteria bacterium]MDQ7020971.1 thymidylate synthase [Candidatus Dojkabacteria bacterium]